jgi:hypothetical protein
VAGDTARVAPLTLPRVDRHVAVPGLTDVVARAFLTRSARTFYTLACLIAHACNARSTILVTSHGRLVRTFLAAFRAPVHATRNRRERMRPRAKGDDAMAKKALAVGVSSYGFPNDVPSGARDAEAFGNTRRVAGRLPAAIRAAAARWPAAAVWAAAVYQQQPFGQQQHFVPGFQGLQAFQPPSPLGGGLQPYELAQIVSTVTPIVAALIQSRSYQGHFGQYLPRAA